MSTKRQLAAIMFTDIVGYTTLMGKDQASALDIVRISKDIQKPLVEKHHGTWLKEMGDGAMAQFSTALDAVHCAVEIQEMARAKLDAKLRIGIHLGDVTIENEDVYGDGVNVASRLESITDPGGIYISDSIEKAARGQMSIQAKYLGELELKNVDYGVRTYALQGTGLPIPEIRQQDLKGHFLAELQRRGVLRAGFAYVAIGVIFSLFWNQAELLGIQLPSIPIQTIIIIISIGFPVAMYLAWSFERSPDGFVRTSSKQSWRNPYSASQRKPLTGNLVIIGLVVVIVVMYFYPGAMGKRGSSVINDKSIAVLHFDNLSTDEENQYFADGVMESILNRLSKVKDLRVTSRTTMEQYRDSKKSIPEIARELEVAYVLEGSVQKYGDQVRVTAQLIDAGSDEHLWSEEYTEPLTDIFALMTRVATDVVTQLEAKLTPGEEEMLAHVPTTDITAYDYYLQGREYQLRYRAALDSENLDYAEELFQQALSEDPSFALAYVGLGEINDARRGLQNSRSPIEKSYIDSILYFSMKAIELDPFLAEAYSLRGIFYASQHKLDDAIQDQEKALELNQNLVEPYIRLSEIYGYEMGDHVQALIYLKKAQRLEKKGGLLIPILVNTAWEYSSIGDYQMAGKYFTRAKQLQPDLIIFWWLQWINSVQGKFDDALAYADSLCMDQPESLACFSVYADVYSFRGEYDKALEYWALVNDLEKKEGIVNRVNDINEAKIYMKTGRTDEARALLEDLLAYWNESSLGSISFRMAEVYAVMGDEEKAVQFLLEQEKANGYAYGMHSLISRYHVFDNLWDNSEFQELVVRLEKKKAEQRKQVQFLEDEGLSTLIR